MYVRTYEPRDQGLGQNPPTPWPRMRKWTDMTPGTTDTYIVDYSKWVANNYQNYNKDNYFCNWFPLRLLVEFASANGLKIRLRYWPGSAPTTPGAERKWDTSTINDFDYHRDGFKSKDEFYTTVKNKVTARMIGSLNTIPITLAD